MGPSRVSWEWLLPSPRLWGLFEGYVCQVTALQALLKEHNAQGKILSHQTGKFHFTPPSRARWERHGERSEC